MTGREDIESQEFFELLTDALRAGPGSPPWHQAVAALRQKNGAGDELALLYAAREHLESGKGYRQVWPGAGFTRKVMDGLELETEARKGGVSPAKVIAVVSALAIVVVAAIVAYWIISKAPRRERVEDLNDLYFANPFLTTTFAGSIPSEWKTIGSLPLTAAGGLHPAESPATDAFRGGGVVSVAPIQPDEALAMDVTIRAAKFSDDLVVQVFVTDDARFSEDRGMSGHELTFFMQNGVAQVGTVDGKLVGQGVNVSPSKEPIVVKVIVSRDVGLVEIGGARVWAGEHRLATKARYVGVRFLKKSSGTGEGIVVESIRVSKAQKR